MNQDEIGIAVLVIFLGFATNWNHERQGEVGGGPPLYQGGDLLPSPKIARLCPQFCKSRNKSNGTRPIQRRKNSWKASIDIDDMYKS